MPIATVVVPCRAVRGVPQEAPLSSSAHLLIHRLPPLLSYCAYLFPSLPPSLLLETVPFRALSGLVVLQVSCGSRHTLAVVEGGVAYSWGWGACGQVGGYIQRTDLTSEGKSEKNVSVCHSFGFMSRFLAMASSVPC